jgi:XTP/dITP diphosphohydrolase
MKKIVFATQNKNKLVEVRNLLPQYEVLGLPDLAPDIDIPETAHTFEGNAALKVDYVTEKFGYDCFSDDSGLEIIALNNEPGIYSARYGGEPGNHVKNIEKVLAKIQGKTQRNARFVTVIALNFNGKQYFFEGEVKGKIIDKPTGNGGFGYDPIFIPDGYDKTFAQMTMEEKTKISHRGKAVAKLISFLNKTRSH